MHLHADLRLIFFSQAGRRCPSLPQADLDFNLSLCFQLSACLLHCPDITRAMPKGHRARTAL